jgi:hypothetical protein
MRLCPAIAVAALVFSITHARADQLDEWCKTAKLPSSVVLCSDPELRGLAIERNEVYAEARARLNPDKQRELLADQNTWVKAYAAACGVPQDAPAPNPVPGSVRVCFRRAGEARIASLRGYGADLSRSPSPVAMPVEVATVVRSWSEAQEKCLSIPIAELRDVNKPSHPACEAAKVKAERLMGSRLVLRKRSKAKVRQPERDLVSMQFRPKRPRDRPCAWPERTG